MSATKGHGEKRERSQEAAIAALLAEPTLKEAARKCRVGESTIRRWLAEPEFQRAFRAARRQIVEAAIGAMQGAASDAVAALKRNLTCGTASSEVQAARVILDQATKAVELVDLMERIEALEAAAHRRAEL